MSSLLSFSRVISQMTYLCLVLLGFFIVFSYAQDPEEAARIAAMKRVLQGNNAAAQAINMAAVQAKTAIKAIDKAAVQAHTGVVQAINAAAGQANNAIKALDAATVEANNAITGVNQAAALAANAASRVNDMLLAGGLN